MHPLTLQSWLAKNEGGALAYLSLELIYVIITSLLMHPKLFKLLAMTKKNFQTGGALPQTG